MVIGRAASFVSIQVRGLVTTDKEYNTLSHSIANRNLFLLIVIESSLDSLKRRSNINQ